MPQFQINSVVQPSQVASVEEPAIEEVDYGSPAKEMPEKGMEEDEELSILVVMFSRLKTAKYSRRFPGEKMLLSGYLADQDYRSFS